MQLEDLEFWIDANLPSSLAFGVSAISFNDLNLLTASDNHVYKLAAQSRNIVVITTKDVD